MVERIVGKYGTNGGHSQAVLNDECPKLRLSHNIVERREAEAAVQRGHAILADVWLTEMGWEAVLQFFQKEPREGSGPFAFAGQACCHGPYRGYRRTDPNVWFLKNSWGPEWAGQRLLPHPQRRFQRYPVSPRLLPGDKSDYR